MAVVSARIAYIEGVGELRMVYDDTLAVFDPEGELGNLDNIANCLLERFEVDVLAPLEILIQRGNGSNWRTATLTQSVTYPAGGPVRRVADIPFLMMRSV